MAEGKNAAQLKNEEEVKRILKERGYSSASSRRQVNKKLGGNFPIIPALSIIVIVIIGGVFGWFFLRGDSSGNNRGEAITDDYSSMGNQQEKTNQEYGDDVKYDNLEAGENKSYPESTTENESGPNKTESKTSSEQKNEAGNQQNTSQNTTTNQPPTSEQAQNQQQEDTTNEKCDNYLATYGNSTPEELARNDNSVQAKYNAWQNWLRQAQEVEGVQFTYQMCQSYWNRGRTCPSQYAGKAQEAEAEYNQLLSQKIEYYKNLRASSCGN